MNDASFEVDSSIKTVEHPNHVHLEYIPLTLSHSPNTFTEVTLSSLFCSLPGLEINSPFNSTQLPVVRLQKKKEKGKRKNG
jgi:hypothetical protein